MSSRKFLTAVFLAVFAIAGLAWGKPVPAASAGNGQGFIGTNVTLPASFENTGDSVGYGPYVDLVLPPAAGADVAFAPISTRNRPGTADAHLLRMRRSGTNRSSVPWATYLASGCDEFSR